MRAWVLPENATEQKLIWQSSNKEVATVKNGDIKAVGEGNAKIVVKANNGVKKVVNVHAFTVEPKEIMVSNESYRLEMTEENSGVITILPENANNMSYDISLNGSDIVDIGLTENGFELTPVHEGKAELVIKTWNDIKKVIPVEVYSIPLNTVKIDDSKVNYLVRNWVDVDGKAIELASVLEPEDCTYPEVIWSSTNEDVVKVEGDQFFIMGTGKVVLTCMSAKDEAICDTLELKIVNRDAMICGGVLFAVAIVGGVTVLLIKRKREKSE